MYELFELVSYTIYHMYNRFCFGTFAMHQTYTDRIKHQRRTLGLDESLEIRTYKSKKVREPFCALPGVRIIQRTVPNKSLITAVAIVASSVFLKTT